MNCEICTFDSATDSLMWKCIGCTRAFHAACVGVAVPRNSLRRNTNKQAVDINSYIIPCCDACQEHLQEKLDFKRLADQQKQLAEQLHANTEVTHRFSLQQDHPRIVHEAVEGLEVLLVAIKNELATINKTSSLAGSVVAIKNHVTSLFDSAMAVTKESVSASLKTVTSDIATDLLNINNEMSQLNQLSLEIAASCNMSTNSVLELDILDELKSLSANLISLRSAAPLSSDSYPSLEVELNPVVVGKSKSKPDDGGWRLIGTRKVWKPDWTDYDARQLHRFAQEKKAAKARKRKKQNKSRYNNHRNNNSKSSNYNSNNRKYVVGNHVNNSHNNLNSHCNNHVLPPDRVLLAAAKDRFSRPPTNFRPTIQFQRGETLNPYPEDDSPQTSQQFNRMTSESSPTILCEACSSQHTCFRPYRRNP